MRVNIVFTYPNRDHGYKEIISILKKFENKKKIIIIKNLGVYNYYQFLKYSDLLIGNSSSGIIESGHFKIPTINIGNRQQGRIKNKNTINCKFDTKDILKKTKKFLKARKKDFKYKDIYRFKSSSKKIINLICKSIY